MNPYLFVGFY